MPTGHATLASRCQQCRARPPIPSRDQLLPLPHTNASCRGARVPPQPPEQQSVPVQSLHCKVLRQPPEFEFFLLIPKIIKQPQVHLHRRQQNKTINHTILSSVYLQAPVPRGLHCGNVVRPSRPCCRAGSRGPADLALKSDPHSVANRHHRCVLNINAKHHHTSLSMRRFQFIWRSHRYSLPMSSRRNIDVRFARNTVLEARTLLRRCP